MGDKVYLTAQSLLLDSFELGIRIYQSGFRPSFIIGIWRGGTPVGIAVQEMLDHLGVKTDHIAIRTSSYYAINQRDKQVKVHGLEYVVRYAGWNDDLLIVDDVFDSGNSIRAVMETLKDKMRRNLPNDIRIATPWFKPANNITDIIPHYYIHESDQWLVFPHELDGLNREEIFSNKPGVAALFAKTGLMPPPE
ncbi:MAG: phosphoribosyltransferase family protein [Desulfobacterales bacterium]|jgi:hypoxanthine phosphoribosyltransferase